MYVLTVLTEFHNGLHFIVIPYVKIITKLNNKKNYIYTLQRDADR